MTLLTVADTCDHLERGGRDFFYLADTVWTAFFDATLEEWDEYLTYRQSQGFNVLQISVLTLWDEFVEDLNDYVFLKNGAGQPDWGAYNAAYFEKAQRMLGMAVARGFVPALVVLWSNHVPGTWQTRNGAEHAMPLAMVPPYVEHVVKTFGRFDPIYIVSGDTNFETPEAMAHYQAALETLKRLSPEALTTMHIWGDSPDIPTELVQNPLLDFYMCQSGHRIEKQDYPVKFAETLYGLPIKRPIVNSEPCYEGGGYIFRKGRFVAWDVRRATWQSLLSGAKAGIGYGAQGLWSWQKPGNAFHPIAQEAFGEALHWRTALHLPGAWDIAFAKWLFEREELFDLEPSTIAGSANDEIRCSAAPDLSKVAVYSPYVTSVPLNLEPHGYRWSLVNLSTREFHTPVVDQDEHTATLQLPQFNADFVLIGRR